MSISKPFGLLKSNSAKSLFILSTTSLSNFSNALMLHCELNCVVASVPHRQLILLLPKSDRATHPTLTLASPHRNPNLPNDSAKTLPVLHSDTQKLRKAIDRHSKYLFSISQTSFPAES